MLHKRPPCGRARWGVVQLVGHLTVNEDGEGSNPSAPAKFSATTLLKTCPLRPASRRLAVDLLKQLFCGPHIWIEPQYTKYIAARGAKLGFFAKNPSQVHSDRAALQCAHECLLPEFYGLCQAALLCIEHSQIRRGIHGSRVRFEGETIIS